MIYCARFPQFFKILRFLRFFFQFFSIFNFFSPFFPNFFFKKFNFSSKFLLFPLTPIFSEISKKKFLNFSIFFLIFKKFSLDFPQKWKTERKSDVCLVCISFTSNVSIVGLDLTSDARSVGSTLKSSNRTTRSPDSLIRTSSRLLDSPLPTVATNSPRRLLVVLQD